jgi:hypothetical protein
MTFVRTKPFVLSRRAALKGLGVMVALPFLDAMRAERARAQAASPRRLFFFYVPCGIRMDTFTPSSEGRDFQLSDMLTPFEKVKGKLSVLSGASNTAAKALGDGGGDHARGIGAFLRDVLPLLQVWRLARVIELSPKYWVKTREKEETQRLLAELDLMRRALPHVEDRAAVPPAVS